MRNDLSRVAEGVHVRRFKYLTELHTSSGPLLQMSSEVVGSVDRSEGLRLRRPHPPAPPRRLHQRGAKGANCRAHPRGGRPSSRLLYRRLRILHGATLDSAVLIRFVEEDASGAHFYRSGGGITINSVAEDEYRECLQKIYIPQ